MAVPKKKTSQSRKGMRQAHDALKGVPAYGENPDTGSLVLRHRASVESDGSIWYRGRKLKEGKAPAAEAPEAAE